LFQVFFNNLLESAFGIKKSFPSPEKIRDPKTQLNRLYTRISEGDRGRGGLERPQNALPVVRNVPKGNS
jgi:hypothetical protein